MHYPDSSGLGPGEVDQTELLEKGLSPKERAVGRDDIRKTKCVSRTITTIVEKYGKRNDTTYRCYFSLI
jgi:hypothetical protein